MTTIAPPKAPPNAGTPVEMVQPVIPSQEAPKSVPTNPEAVPGTALPGTTVETTNLENLNKPEDINAALEEAAKVMLQLRDVHLSLVALARQCGDTPMGRELQYDVLQTIRGMSVKDRKIQQRLPLAQLQKKLGELTYPKEPPAEAFGKFLVDNKDKFPPGHEPARVALELNSGNMHVADLVKIFQGNKDLTDLRKPFFTALMGDKSQMDMGAMLAGVNIDVNKNQAALEQTFKNPIQQHGGFDKTLAIGIGFLAMTSFIQMMQQDAQPQRSMAGG